MIRKGVLRKRMQLQAHIMAVMTCQRSHTVDVNVVLMRALFKTMDSVPSAHLFSLIINACALRALRPTWKNWSKEKDKKIYPGESEMIKKSIDMLVELIIGVCREWSWGNVLKNTNAAPFLQNIHSAQFIHVDLSCWETREERRARAQSITTTSVPRKCSRLPDKCTLTKPNHPNGMHSTAWA